jgi:hypothetical protein
MLITSLGSALAGELGASEPPRLDSPEVPLNGELEKFARLMMKTSANQLQPKLVESLKSGTKLETLVAAGALANARTFGGTDYQGFHAFMALMPSYRLAQRMPKNVQALPVLKVLYRNTARIQRAGRGKQKLQPIEASSGAKPSRLRDEVRGRDMRAAEANFAKACESKLTRAYDDLQWLIQDGTDVHRVVLPWRAWDTLQLTGREHAHTILRQCVRYCVDAEQTRVRRERPEPEIRKTLPKVLDEHRLLSKKLGDKKPDDKWIEELSGIVFGNDRPKAAHAVAAALAEGFAPEAIGEAISLAANQLLLHNPGDPNRRGGVHGASIGVHASDAANAWRHIARVTNHRNQVASLIVAAYHTAGQARRVQDEPLAYEEAAKRLEAKDPTALLRETEVCIKNRDQVGVCANVHRYGELGLPSKGVIDLMLKYAVSEDGALHAEKYFQTAVEEFETMRPAFRWRQLVTLARVTASEYGEPAPGCEAARKLLLG